MKPTKKIRYAAMVVAGYDPKAAAKLAGYKGNPPGGAIELAEKAEQLAAAPELADRGTYLRRAEEYREKARDCALMAKACEALAKSREYPTNHL